jgi:hypothetical protein
MRYEHISGFGGSGTGFLAIAAVSGPERCGFYPADKDLPKLLKKQQPNHPGGCVIGLVRGGDITHLGNDNRANLTNQFSQRNN